MNMEKQQSSTPFQFADDPDLKRLDSLAKLLDNQFVIPGTSYPIWIGWYHWPDSLRG